MTHDDTTKGDGASLMSNVLQGPHVHIVDSPKFNVTATEVIKHSSYVYPGVA